MHNVGKQAGLGFGAEIGVVDRRHAVVIATLVLVGVSVNVVTAILQPPLAVGLLLIAVVSALVLRLLGPALELGSTFPELGRFRLLRWLVR